MSIATKSRKRVKTERTANVRRVGNMLVLFLTVDGKTTAYGMRPLASDFGKQAVRLSKADQGSGPGEVYDVLLDGEKSSCECKGFLAHGHCKHVSGLAAVVASGSLADALPEPEETVEITAEPPAPAPEPEERRRCFDCGKPCDDFYCDRCGIF